MTIPNRDAFRRIRKTVRDHEADGMGGSPGFEYGGSDDYEPFTTVKVLDPLGPGGTAYAVRVWRVPGDTGIESWHEDPETLKFKVGAFGLVSTHAIGTVFICMWMSGRYYAFAPDSCGSGGT
jgi:hypothetical protein